jgi:hypothetical protein
MTYLEAIQQLSLDHRGRLRQGAEAERLAVQARGRRRHRRRRLALNAALERLLRGRHEATHRSALA